MHQYYFASNLCCLICQANTPYVKTSCKQIEIVVLPVDNGKIRIVQLLHGQSEFLSKLPPSSNDAFIDMKGADILFHKVLNTNWSDGSAQELKATNGLH